ncbi:MAG TPA: S41 family peptidase, partial [Longimicrobiales bacterium]
SRQWDVRWPSADPATGKIVFEMGFELHVLDTRTGQVTPLRIFVPHDALYSRPTHMAAANRVENYGLSPKGERAVFAARGDIFSAPIEKGATRNLTGTSNAHDKAPDWSPDGRRVVFLSDRSGEEELWLVAQDGSSAPEQLTRGGQAMRYAPTWSPDGSRIAFGDKNGKLFVLTMSDRKITEIADDPRGTINDFTWSPRGNHLAFSMNDARGISAIYIWGAADGALHKLTEGFFGEYAPAWDADGNYLYFLSRREFAPQLSNIEWNYAGNRNTRIYALSLRKDVKNPFPWESDEVKPADTATAAPAGKAAASAPAPRELRIDFDGSSSRISALPLEADNYFGLSANKGNLFYVVGGAGFYGRTPEKRPALRVFSIADRKETTLADGVSGYVLSADGSKIMTRDGNNFAIYDAKPAGSKKSIATNGLYVDRVPTEEWAQIFDEVWRRYRDFFYVENMHGNDWEALRAQYRPLLQYVQHRSDLNYVIAEMLAELSIQHAYIAGGDWDAPPRPQVALPGARFELEPATGRYRITKIFAGENEEPVYRSPLREVGVDVAVGDYILAIDGQPLRADEDPYSLLRYKADRPVRLTVSRTPAASGAREVMFRPLTREGDLVYLDWVEANRKRVEELSGGRVGYLHVPDMGANGIREFIKWYYPQVRKQGLVIDVRANGGGNVSSMLIDRLSRTLLATGYARNDDYPSTYPRGAVFYGSMATILDENSASDGDIFPAMFRQSKLGPLIGKRSWGGVIGITDHGTLIDGGSVNVPEFGFSGVNGEWIIEGHGVDPDIEVEQDPVAVLQGKDPQLERAVQEVLRLIAANPKSLPPRAKAPVKVK